MCVAINDIVKLRPSVAVTFNGGYVEFFLSDIRKTVTVKLQSEVVSVLFKLNGTQSLNDFFISANITDLQQQTAFFKLISFLNENHIVINIDEPYIVEYEQYSRVFSILENYYSKQSEINNAFKKIQKSRVMIVGLGSVGTWVTQSLMMSGVSKFVLVDADNVELSNLHRQFGFGEKSIGCKKTTAMKERLLQSNKNIEVECIDEMLTCDFFTNHKFDQIDLIINCADKPSVDITSLIVSEYAMQYGIPHIVGGGYNLHLTLIGQVVIPGKTACCECFRLALNELNDIDTTNIRKLPKKSEVIGSFPPLSNLAASIAANEAFKILAGLENELVMKNNRTEFNISDMNFHNIKIERNEKCKWCGYEGKYYQLSRNKD